MYLQKKKRVGVPSVGFKSMSNAMKSAAKLSPKAQRKKPKASVALMKVISQFNHIILKFF